jgi:hypothetical protein
MAKQLLLVASIIMTALHASAQLDNFDGNGHKTRLASEKVVVTVKKLPVRNAAAPSFLLSNASSLVGLGIGLVKTALDKRSQSFTASYSGMLTDETLTFFDDSTFSPFSLKVERNTGEKEGENPDFRAAMIALSVSKEDNDGVFRFRLDSIALTRAKARITKSLHSTGKTVDININVKIKVLYRDEVKADTVSGKASADSADKRVRQAEVKTATSYTLKSATLGESSITVNGIHPGTTKDFSKETDNSFYSDWFQLIPAVQQTKDAKKLTAGKRYTRCWTTITVTVKEANPYGVEAGKISDYFSNSNSEIASFLNALIPGNSSSKGSGSGK